MPGRVLNATKQAAASRRENLYEKYVRQAELDFGTRRGGISRKFYGTINISRIVHTTVFRLFFSITLVYHDTTSLFDMLETKYEGSL